MQSGPNVSTGDESCHDDNGTFSALQRIGNARYAATWCAPPTLWYSIIADKFELLQDSHSFVLSQRHFLELVHELSPLLLYFTYRLWREYTTNPI